MSEAVSREAAPSRSSCIERTTDVLVIGSGPMGATTALALATYGIKVHMVSRRNWLADSPRAHITNQRAMEVFRDLGLEEEVNLLATPWELMGDTLFTTSLAGEELVRLRTWGTGDRRKGDYIQGSPCGMADLIQSKLEPVLFKNAAERGATFAFNTEYLRHEQDPTGVTATLKDRISGREYGIRTKYLVGADGAKSTILDELGLPVEGHLARAGTVYFQFEADLTKYVAHRPSILNWIVTSHASFGELGVGLLRAVKPWTRWIAGWGFDISKGDPDVSAEMATTRIRALIGDPTIDLEIIGSSVWYVNQAYAPHYSKGRVFCGGDAVHRHPPSSGLGSNTCVQDAFNLAWKLAFVLKGFAGEGLLVSYSDERAPIGKQVVLRANQSRLDYAGVNACFRVEGAQNPIAAGIERFKSSGPEGVTARRQIEMALEVKNSEFNAHGVELNQRYVSDAVVPDPLAGEETWQRDPVTHYQPTTRPGAKLPHVWLVGRNGRKVSTLDVTGGGMFSLITGLAGAAWVSAADALNFPFLRVVLIGAVNTRDLYCDWQRVREVEEAGAILVRPDGYVAWREPRAVCDRGDALRLLSGALSSLLDRPSLTMQDLGVTIP